MARQNKRRGEKRKSERQMDADERQSNRDGISSLEQISVLDKRLGAGNGALKERMRLDKLIQKPEEKVEETTDAEV
jgi:hypothetical protein